MLVLAPLISLVTAVAALQNPHRKAPSFRQPADDLRKREVSASPAEYKYLNEKTQSKCGTLWFVESKTGNLQFISARIPSEWNSLPASPF